MHRTARNPPAGTRGRHGGSGSGLTAAHRPKSDRRSRAMGKRRSTPTLEAHLPRKTNSVHADKRSRRAASSGKRVAHESSDRLLTAAPCIPLARVGRTGSLCPCTHRTLNHAVETPAVAYCVRAVSFRAPTFPVHPRCCTEEHARLSLPWGSPGGREEGGTARPPPRLTSRNPLDPGVER